MKKIISLLIISIFIISCTDNAEEEKTTIEKPIIENENVAEVEDKNNETSTENEEPKEDNKTEKTTDPVKENTETAETKDETTETPTDDEKMLESEVNDLLDEFIDSLENYDK